MDMDEKTESEQHLSCKLGTSSNHKLICQYCGQKFTITQNLKRHLKNQHLGFRFPCASCAVEVTRREDIYKHYTTYHPEKMDEVYAIKEVSKMTEDGKIKPLGRMTRVGEKRRKRRGGLGNKKDNQVKRESHDGHLNSTLSETQKVDFLHMEDSDVSDSQTVQSSPPGNVGNRSGAEPQRVAIALDPVTQFRLERVVAERVHKIIEKSVVETLDKFGRVTRRETIEREYNLSSEENCK